MKYKKIFIPIITVFILLIPLIASAQATNLLSGIDCIKSGNCDLCDFIQIFVNSSDVLVGLSGTFAILMFIYGGIVMITAYGNEAKIKWGKDILVATVVASL